MEVDVAATLHSLKSQYLQVVDPNAIIFPSPQLLLEVSFQAAIYEHVFSPSTQPVYAPPKRYTARVLKRMITLISEQSAKADEHHNAGEIDSSLLELYTELISTPVPSYPLEKIAVTYMLPSSPVSKRALGAPITVFESPNLISGQGTTGLRTWEASLALSEWLILSRLHSIYKSTTSVPCVQMNLTLEDETIVELGAGTGLVSLVASILGAKRVISTDGDEGVCAGLKKNIQINGMAQSVSVEQLLWDTHTPVPKEVSLVLGADVIYDKRVIPALVSQIKTILWTDNCTRVMLTATLRNLETFGSFRDHISENGMVLSEHVWPTVDPPIFYYSRKTPVILIEILKKEE